MLSTCDVLLTLIMHLTRVRACVQWCVYEVCQLSKRSGPRLPPLLRRVFCIPRVVSTIKRKPTTYNVCVLTLVCCWSFCLNLLDCVMCTYVSDIDACGTGFSSTHQCLLSHSILSLSSPFLSLLSFSSFFLSRKVEKGRDAQSCGDKWTGQGPPDA